jgi:glycosyltransferase XagB
VLIFRRSTAAVVCLQARLNYYNPEDNLLTRWFALEYTTWFDLYLPGLHTLRAPIPLGGTSNHFRTHALRASGGWDPWNVTEDCDLGLRLARAGQETRIMDSTTWEEAVNRLRPWIRQRSRWTKGYWQTLLAHTRSPLAALRSLGLWRLLQMLLVVGGQVFSLLLAPIAWAVLAAWACVRWPLFHPEVPRTRILFVVFAFMLLCNALFVAMHVLGAWQRKQRWLTPAAVLLPFYWILMGLGAWRGMLQHLWAPFK